MEGQGLPNATATSDVATSFGDFRLYPERHLLVRDQEPVAIGSRALDILIALTERPGELLTKDELIARAWPNTIVEESNLRAQIAVLRKALCEDQSTTRYIAAVPARGYRFIAPIYRSALPTGLAEDAAPNNLPRLLTQPVGREEAIAILEGRVRRSRLVSVVGPGGIGKTTVGIRVAEELSSSYEHGVCFLDLAPLRNPSSLSSVLASQLRLPEITGDTVSLLTAHLRDKNMLLVFDSCELVLDAAAELAEVLLREAPGIGILATSREALRVEGESVYRLPALDMPPVGSGLTATDALAFPAIRLFVDRATSSGSEFEFDDDEAPIVTHICRQLDGIALAIELAAGRVEAFGTRGIAELLNDRLRLLTGGRRTALPRHQTLAAMIDWSYGALSREEQAVLRGLAVFPGEFGREAAAAVAFDPLATECDVLGQLARLVAKSLLAVDTHGKAARYRLLDTTRAFAASKLQKEGEVSLVVQRLARYLCETLENSAEEVETLSSEDWLLKYGSQINNVRYVLEWAYSDNGDPDVGIAVTVSAIPLWYQLSLVDECLACVRRALLAIDPGEKRDGRARQVMQLYRALGLSQAFKVGFAPQAPAAFAKALEIAEEQGDVDGQAEALWGLWIAQVGMGEYRASRENADRFVRLARNSLDRFIGDRMLSMTLFCMGDFRGARRHADLMLEHDVSTELPPGGYVRFRFGQSVSARIQPAQLLWMQGFPDQAVRAAAAAVEAARISGHAISLCEALARWSCPILVHVGDLKAADSAITELFDLAQQNGLGPWEVFGRCWKAALLIQRGHPERGVPLLRNGLAELRQVKLFNLYNVRFVCFLAEGLTSLGKHAEALALVEAAIAASEDKDELWYISELYRLKGDILAKCGHGGEAEQCFLHSLELARHQDALSLELRVALSLSQIIAKRGERAEAHELLARVYERFSEGFETADLQAAKVIMAELS
ncbi:ATP-binding protein [Agrobacterium pusense]|uniref:ATP-binding protein n=1 Tax=Agrobacterium pusense TaxID=648995 RepID=UPI001AE7F780|nr:winged helix-turn-helix domain-containing protein [Agrobacterium pusense]MBP2611480.1 putative ATPase/DNA-binding winged helix-turn-helix (wHTH) protein [Agrobacterium pusense]